MQLTATILRCVLLTVIPAVVCAQENFLKKEINLQLENVSVEDALLKIADQGGFNFSYNADIIRTDSLLTLNEPVTVKEALDKIFRGEANYHATGSYLVIQARQKQIQLSGKQEYTITGYVLNHLTGEKIPYVSVYEVNSLASTLTDNDGYFNLAVTSERNYLGLAVAREAFLDTVLIVEPVDKPLTIYMKPKIETVYQPVGIESEIQPPKIDELKIVQRLVKEDQRKEARNIRLFRTTPVQVSLIPSVSVNSLNGSAANNFSLNIFGGYSKGLKGVEVGGLFNILREDMKGVEVAGLANFVGGEVEGLQVAGLYNHTIGAAGGMHVAGILNINYETLTGVQVAGILNHVTKDVKGMQVSGIGNDSWGAVDGFQVGGIYNFARKDVNLFQVGGIVNHSRHTNGFQVAGIVNNATDVKGFQISGIANHGRTVHGFQVGGIANAAHDSVGGFQFAGIANYARKLGGFQFAGIVNAGSDAPKGQFAGILNVATGEVRGVQLSGLVNFARRVHGVQIGALNVSDTVSGVPVGILSFVAKGYHSGDVSFSDTYTTNLAFRTGVRSFYNIFTGGARLHDFQSFMTAGYGIGTTFNSSGKLGYSLEAVQRVVFEKDRDDHGLSHHSQLGFYCRFLNRKRISIIAGPTFNVLVTGWKDPESGVFLSRVAPYSLFKDRYHGNLVQGWIGFRMGVEYR